MSPYSAYTYEYTGMKCHPPDLTGTRTLSLTDSITNGRYN